jgi:hypothetical protein
MVEALEVAGEVAQPLSVIGVVGPVLDSVLS